MSLVGADNTQKGDQIETQATEEQLEEKLKEKMVAESEDVEIPDSLKPENIEKMLQEKSENQSVQKRRWRPLYTAAAAAACCVLIIGIAVVGNRSGQKQADLMSKKDVKTDHAGEAADTGKHTKDQAMPADIRIASAKDYDEIYQYIKAEKESQEAAARSYEGGQFDEKRSDDSAVSGESSEKAVMDAAAGSAESVKSDLNVADTGSSYSDTNIREEGVGEGDIVKTDGKHLFILNGQKIQIVDIQSKEMKALSTIRLDDDQYISELYVKDDRLIIVYTKSEYEEGDNEYNGIYKQYTSALTYDISNPEKPKDLGEITQSGNFYTMRQVGDYVYLFSNFYADVQAARKDTGAYIPEINGKILDSGNILLPPYARGNQYTVVSSFSLKDPDKKTDSKAVFGSAGLIYVSNDNIYVCEAYYDSKDSDVTQTCIRKVAYKDGKLEAVGQTRIDGTLNDSFSIDEYKGNLRLVTTVSSTGGGAFPIVIMDDVAKIGDMASKDSNTLYILDENLEELSRLEGLAKDEQVYSARFMGDTGYVVTYKQVDPLFSIDLSDPKKPEVLGELKIPGFSDYLHPYGDHLLLGIGMDVDETGTTTNGVKLSMFDSSDPEDVKEIQKYVMEDTYSTNVSYNYKAVLISTDKNLIGFSAYGKGQYYYLFSYDEKKGFVCIFERELNGYSEGRGIYSGDTFYLIAGNTVESYTMDKFEKIDDIVL